MLEIQKFIKAHDNWRELLSTDPYNLKISEDDGFVLFKYNQIASDFSQEICKEARGLILDMQDDFRVVRYAFKKFFNIDEGFAAHIDWDTAVASEKIDGSIMSLWYARGKWHLSTNGTIDAFKAEINGVGPYKTFGELFESACPAAMYVNIKTNYCYTFELVSPYTKVVIDYPYTKIYLLSVRNMDTLKEVDYDELSTYADNLVVSYPQFYYMNDEAGFRKLVEDMPEGHEGIVVRDENGERVKIKTLLYFQMHKAKNNGVITLERIVDLIRANDQHEFLSYFPEYKDIFEQVQLHLVSVDFILLSIRVTVEQWKQEYANVVINDPRMARKWFAHDVAGKTKYAALYFAEYDGRLGDMLADMPTSKFISMFGIELPKEDK